MSPQNDEAPSGQGRGLPETHSADAEIISDAEAERNRFSVLAKRAAKAGHHLQKVGSGFILSRWCHAIHFIDLDSAQALIVRMEGGEP